MRKLPIGVQAFEVMRGRNFVYVDKTQGIHRLVDEGMYYFLARPRRFGKSLLVSTLRSLFEAKRELFKGLWIDEPGRWAWRPHPVVVIDFNGLAVGTPENLRLSLTRQLFLSGRAFQIELVEPLLEGQFKEPPSSPASPTTSRRSATRPTTTRSATWPSPPPAAPYRAAC